MSKRRSVSCRHANATFVAIRRVGVGPGVKMDSKRLVMKAAMIAYVWECACRGMVGVYADGLVVCSMRC